DAATVVVIGLWYPRDRSWRLAIATFYAFNPFLLFWWTVTAEDKTLIFLLLVLVLLGLERAQPVVTWTAPTLLAVGKWLSGFFLVPLAVYTAARFGLRRSLVYLGVFVAAVVVAQVPYFPSSLLPYRRRQARIGIDPPEHTSITRFLHEAHIYAPVL